jgi:uncharacterized 2Fe-2S/4Fe-4S cluster protein (DUF4445 family)
MKKSLFMAVIVLLLVAVLLPCVGCADSAGGRANIVNIGMTDTVPSVNPLLLDASEIGKTICDFQFLQLCELNSDLEFEGMLADSITTEDHIHFTVHIDDAAVWSDGTPITADDLVFSVLRYASPAVGNTAMLHLLTGTDPTPLAAAPFILKRTFGEWEGTRYYPPCISAYVGADMTAAILSSGMCESPDQTALLIDVGTNGEMALLHQGALTCCSTAAGPAFEGAGISCGSMAVPGAVSDVWAEDGRICYRTIDNCPPVGLCGTGLIDAAATLRELGLMEDSGFMEDNAPLGDSGLVLTRADIRQLQLAKAAIRAGIDTLLSDRGLTYADVDVLYLAGGFGSYLHPESCAAIGMIPRELIDKIQVLGNAAGQGASMMLLSAAELARAEGIARGATTLELSTSAVFMEKYVDGMMFGEG